MVEFISEKEIFRTTYVEKIKINFYIQ